MALHYNGEVQIKKLALGPYQANCYIVICPETAESVIIDTPAEASTIMAEAKGTSVKYIVITHSHFDHIQALDQVRSQTKAPVAVHPLDAPTLNPDLNLNEGDTLKIGQIALKVLHTPGHTPGSICLLTGRHLISGDTLFTAGPGKTSTPESFARIVESITRSLFVLPDDTVVYPGHGPDTILGKEKEEFRQFSSRPHNPDLCGDVLWLTS